MKLTDRGLKGLSGDKNKVLMILKTTLIRHGTGDVGAFEILFIASHLWWRTRAKLE